MQSRKKSRFSRGFRVFSQFAVAALLTTASVSWATEQYPAPPLHPKPPRPRQWQADPEIQKQWHLDKIGAKNVWKISQGDPDTVIAIVDSGINYNHPDLAPNIRWKMSEFPMNGKDKDGNGFIDDVIGWDFVKSNALPWDRSWHGTFLAGIIAAVEGNGIGVAGVCPKCSILPVRFLNWEGLGDTEDAIKGLRYAIAEKASVINFSFSGEGYDKDLYNAIVEAGKADILVVAAASNDGLNDDYQDIYPAKFNLPNLITIAASTQDDKLWEESNWGKRTVHIAAPGDHIYSIWGEKIDEGSGTSDAAAVVSGAAGLLRSIAPHLSAEEVKQVFMATATPSRKIKNKLVVDGVLNLEAAVACARAPGLPCLRGQQRP